LNEVIIRLIGQTTYLRPTCHRASSGNNGQLWDGLRVRCEAGMGFSGALTSVVLDCTRTRLRYNLRPTTHECVHLVRRGHFRLRHTRSWWSHQSIDHT